ncbi:hypothetical protein PVK06_030530 [Gossypium arboreum]|uniref:Reverse transcriptase n=1 Tax=Gossypium arboreum TaxID=29729 RepID=A0ABR0NPK9_GOSAR|nr:hypothetical protein PVK06_030530 [Gossypium arboreum]
MLNEGDWKPKDEKWKSVWKLLGPQRVRFFIRTALQGSLLSNVERVRQGLAADSSCSFCGFHSEDILHILRDCAVAKEVWNQVLPVLKVDAKRSFNCTIEEEPFEDPIFLTTDGAVQIETGNGAASGIIRNANGDWILGYNRHLGKCSIFNAKLWGILEGLRRIQSILSPEKRWCLRYIPRDQNQVADCLAKQALSRPDILQVFDSPHPMTHKLIDLDKMKNIFSFQNNTL